MPADYGHRIRYSLASNKLNGPSTSFRIILDIEHTWKLGCKRQTRIWQVLTTCLPRKKATYKNTDYIASRHLPCNMYKKSCTLVEPLFLNSSQALQDALYYYAKSIFKYGAIEWLEYS